METKTHSCIVIGTGAAGFSAACRLKRLGVSVAMVTEGIKFGTSRNTGSDKQTYYKLGLSGDRADSVRKMAQNLFDGGCVDGDNALCEASLSSRSFLHLCELGVPFPTNRYGEYVGYKTDHDPYERATSAGPLTSKYMTEALEKEARALEIPIYDKIRAVKILVHDNRVCGFIGMKKSGLIAFRCGDLVLATGGPAGIYADSVYPACHRGATGLAVEAGAKLQNPALWQYGLASANPRWNVSGSYMQVLPRFVSIDENGKEHDFLWDFFQDRYRGLSLVFLKGYQWPFDPKKAENGSSLIDLAVHRERVEKGRRVFLDFMHNPFDMDFSKLSGEAYDYLKRAGVCFGTPIERLEKMNAPAVELYREKGVDLHREYLEIALCAQHNNGGIGVDLWWQSSVKGLFAVGECAGTHGISRPGGSALNAGQVGALRAAQYVASHPSPMPKEDLFCSLAGKVKIRKEPDAPEKLRLVQRRMSDTAAAVRDPERIRATLQAVLKELDRTADPDLRDVLLTQGAVLTAMAKPNGDPESVQEVLWDESGYRLSLRRVRPIPRDDDFFENVWRSFRETKNVF